MSPPIPSIAWPSKPGKGTLLRVRSIYDQKFVGRGTGMKQDALAVEVTQDGNRRRMRRAVYLYGPITNCSTFRGSLSVLATFLCVVSSSTMPTQVYPVPISSSDDGAGAILA